MRADSGAVFGTDCRVAFRQDDPSGHCVAVSDVVVSDPEFDCVVGMDFRIGDSRPNGFAHEFRCGSLWGGRLWGAWNEAGKFLRIGMSFRI